MPLYYLTSSRRLVCERGHAPFVEDREDAEAVFAALCREVVRVGNVIDQSRVKLSKRPWERRSAVVEWRHAYAAARGEFLNSVDLQGSKR
ncbi:MAG TPA: hypothetical protein VGG64_08830 [Pirellulales bacterium]|jgi:hypothetical protein